MSTDDPNITDPIDVARLVFGAEDGVVQGDVTWRSYVDTDADGTISAAPPAPPASSIAPALTSSMYFTVCSPGCFVGCGGCHTA